MIETRDYEEAARMANTCRASGVQGSGTDFIICAVSLLLAAPIYTHDQDFAAFARLIPIKLRLP
jgi:predicted nucleic acid-binding protein